MKTKNNNILEFLIVISIVSIIVIVAVFLFAKRAQAPSGAVVSPIRPVPRISDQKV